jgi:hypothetical protein
MWTEEPGSGGRHRSLPSLSCTLTFLLLFFLVSLSPFLFFFVLFFLSFPTYLYTSPILPHPFLHSFLSILSPVYWSLVVLLPCPSGLVKPALSRAAHRISCVVLTGRPCCSCLLFDQSHSSGPQKDLILNPNKILREGLGEWLMQ